MNKFSIAVIGAGASGLAAAIQSASLFEKNNTDYEITVFEHLSKAAKKILVTGNGRCNFTNTSISPENYHGNTELILSVLNSGYSDTAVFFEEKGMKTYCEEGRIYPRSQQASSLRNMLLDEIQSRNIHVRTDAEPAGIEVRQDRKFIIDGSVYDSVIVACGGLASKSQGSDGSFYPVLKALGHTFTEMRPALTAFLSNDKDLRELKGIRTRGTLSLICGTSVLGSESGEIQFTDRAISGIPAFQLSYLYRENAVISADCLNDMSKNEAEEYFSVFRNKKPYAEIETALSCLVPERLGYVIINRTGIKPRTKLKELGKSDFSLLTETAKNLRFRLSGTRPFEDAQVTAGGINTDEIDIKTLMSRKHSGIFFCGEILDANGDCGGYNLHFAFASGRIAGSSAYEYVTKE